MFRVVRMALVNWLMEREAALPPGLFISLAATLYLERVVAGDRRSVAVGTRR
jgi:hypothetical protein